MKAFILIFIVFWSSVVFAQNSRLATIYSQIPPIPDKLLCESPGNLVGTISQIESLSAQLNEMRGKLDEESKTERESAYLEMSAGFPTDEELKRVEKLSEEQQRAFWEKIEADQTNLENAVSKNTIKYQAEKEALNHQIGEYNNKHLEMTEAYSKVHVEAMKRKSDKRQIIYNTCMVNNTLTDHGRQQIAEIAVEFCATVSPVMLKNLRFEYAGLKQNMASYSRLTAIELVEFSTLKEEEIYKQNAALLDLTALEVLAQFLNNYKQLFDFLPGSVDNQN